MEKGRGRGTERREGWEIKQQKEFHFMNNINYEEYYYSLA